MNLNFGHYNMNTVIETDKMFYVIWVKRTLCFWILCRFIGRQRKDKQRHGVRSGSQSLMRLQIDNVIFIIINYMQEGHRNTNTCGLPQAQSPVQSVFLLRRIAESTGGLEIRVDFSPVARPGQTTQSGKPATFRSLPTFNRDMKFYTPSFVLEEDMTKFEQNNDELLINHQRKMEEFLEEKEELLVPKPSKANRFCLICKQTYDDYLTHITNPSHTRLLKASAFYNDVSELCTRIYPHSNFKLNKKIVKEKKPRQGKANPKTVQIRSQKSSESLSTGLQTPNMGQMLTTIK